MWVFVLGKQMESNDSNYTAIVSFVWTGMGELDGRRDEMKLWLSHTNGFVANRYGFH